MKRRTFARRALAVGALSVGGCIEGSDPDERETEPDTEPPTDEPESAYGDATDTRGETDRPSESTGASSEDASGESESRDSSGTPTAGDWPTFGGDDGHTGYRPNGVGPAEGRIAWSGIGDAPTVLCAPTVADSVVYTGSAANAVHAFDAATGDPLWTFETDAYVETAPTVSDGRVYAADADGVVYALTTDGEAVWRHETGQNLHSRSIVVRDGTVVVGTAGDMPMVVSGDTDASKAGVVVAVDADSGEEVWTHEGPEDWFTGPAFGDGRVYVANHSGAAFALDPDTGERIWSWGDATLTASASVVRPPAYADGTVYVGVHGDGAVAAIDAATGDSIWTAPLEANNVKSSPAVTGDRVYVGAQSVRGEMPDETPGDGTPHETPNTDTSADGPAGETAEPEPAPMPVVESTGRLYALDRADGSEAWVHEADHDFRSSPAVVGDRVYVGGGDGVLAVDRRDGTERWRVAFDDYVDSSPAVVDGRLFVGSADGSLYCVGSE